MNEFHPETGYPDDRIQYRGRRQRRVHETEPALSCRGIREPTRRLLQRYRDCRHAADTVIASHCSVSLMRAGQSESLLGYAP